MPLNFSVWEAKVGELLGVASQSEVQCETLTLMTSKYK